MQFEDEEEGDEGVDPIPDLHTRFLGLSTSTGTASQRHADSDPGDEVEYLLQELRERIARTSDNEGENVKGLVKEAKTFVASSGPLTRSDDSPERKPGRFEGHEEDDLAEDADVDADEYMKRIVDGLRAEALEASESGRHLPDTDNPSKDHDHEYSPKDDEDREHISPFNLPETHSALLPQSAQEEDQQTSDATHLPSAPTFLPAEHPIHITNNRGGKHWTGNGGDAASAPPTWCCICSDDATIKCLDCGGDLIYCARCWKEMHSVEGDEERRHRGVEFPGKKIGAGAQ